MRLVIVCVSVSVCVFAGQSSQLLRKINNVCRCVKYEYNASGRANKQCNYGAIMIFCAPQKRAKRETFSDSNQFNMANNLTSANCVSLRAKKKKKKKHWRDKQDVC